VFVINSYLEFNSFSREYNVFSVILMFLVIYFFQVKLFV